MPARRLAALFRRYAQAHLALEAPGTPLHDEDGRLVGQVDRLRLTGGRLWVDGWTAASAVSLRQGASRADRVPDLIRPDVARMHPGLAGPAPGFAADLPWMGGPVHLGLGFGDRRLIFALNPPPTRALRRAGLRLLPRFLADLTRAAPAAALWWLRRNPAHRQRVKARLRLTDAAPAQGLQRLLFLEDSLSSLPEPARAAERARLMPAALRDRGVTIVLPIHNAFDLLPEVLDRVRRHTDLPWHLVLIEDASTDPGLRPWLRRWVAAQPAGRVTLIEHATNLGFIRSANAGLAVALERGEDAVLLNSDAFVPEGWASRLLRPMLAHDRVASVTPLSNDAEILTVPAICARTPLHPGEADRLDALARGFHPDAALADVPTGVGFCMAIAQAWLRKAPTLDTAFGRGYGEEVDWCRRVGRMGGRHLALAGLFVEHRGGSSFGSAEKQRRIAANNALVERRHPGFDAEVQAFIQADPLGTPRLALALALAAGRVRGRMPIYLAHSLGGGAEDWLRARLAADLGAEGPGAAVVLRVGGRLRWQIDLHLPEGKTSGATDDVGFVERLLEPVGARNVIYSCGVGDPDPAELPARLRALARPPGSRIEVLFHDYLPISPSYTLTDADGRHRGLPDPDRADSAHRSRGRPLADWQEAWGRLIAAADAVTVFSRDSHRMVLAAYPQARGTIRLRPHRLLHPVPACPAPLAGRPVIGVLGNIGAPKGAAVVAGLSRKLAATGVADLVLLGQIDPAFTLAPNARLHGAYRREDIAALVARYGIDRWLIPSAWPETFSYTSHEALATGLPVWCFDLGAQGEAVRSAARETGLGGTIPLKDGVADLDLVMACLLAPAARRAGRAVA